MGTNSNTREIDLPLYFDTIEWYAYSNYLKSELSVKDESGSPQRIKILGENYTERELESALIKKFQVPKQVPSFHKSIFNWIKKNSYTEPSTLIEIYRTFKSHTKSQLLSFKEFEKDKVEVIKYLEDKYEGYVYSTFISRKKFTKDNVWAYFGYYEKIAKSEHSSSDQKRIAVKAILLLLVFLSQTKKGLSYYGISEKSFETLRGISGENELIKQDLQKIFAYQNLKSSHTSVSFPFTKRWYLLIWALIALVTTLYLLFAPYAKSKKDKKSTEILSTLDINEEQRADLENKLQNEPFNIIYPRNFTSEKKDQPTINEKEENFIHFDSEAAEFTFRVDPVIWGGLSVYSKMLKRKGKLSGIEFLREEKLSSTLTVKSDPIHLAYVGRALTCRRFGFRKQCILNMDTAIMLTPKALKDSLHYAKLHLFRGLFKQENTQYKEAIEDFNYAVKAGVDETMLWVGKGVSHYMLGEWDLAVPYLEKIVVTTTDSMLTAKLYLELAICHLNIAREDKYYEDKITWPHSKVIDFFLVNLTKAYIYSAFAEEIAPTGKKEKMTEHKMFVKKHIEEYYNKYAVKH